MMFMGLGIVDRRAASARITIRMGGVPLSLSTSGGALIAGLVCGWLRSVNPTFGRIPAPALWVFNNIGLNTFIAVVGHQRRAELRRRPESERAGPVPVRASWSRPSRSSSGSLPGKYLFKMHPAILLGACAGARTTTAALGAIQEVAKSKVPALGYTVTYAVGNTLLTIWGVVIVLLMK